MKKLTAVISLLLILCLLFSTSVFAQTAEDQTAVLDIDSVEPGDLAAEDSYVLTDGGAPVLIVEHHNEVVGATAALDNVADNGYYTAEFVIPETTKKVFLTGLTRDNIAEIEEEFYFYSSFGEDFELEDLGFVDAEKTYDEDDDDEMCWAASASNILAYTGWGAQAGFGSEDDLFELFINSYSNDGGSTYYGVQWFFDGTDAPSHLGADGSFASVVDYPNSGGYLPDYTFDTVTGKIELDKNGASGMAELLRQLKCGRGIELGLDLYKYGSYSNGHAVTCWGLVTDLSYAPSAKEYYDSVLITDSDTGEYENDRRKARDVMDVNVLEPYEDGNMDTYLFDIGSGYTAMIYDAVSLKPYSADIPKETSASANRNRRTTPDISMDMVALSRSSSDVDSVTEIFPASSTVYISPHFSNYSDVEYTGAFTISYKLTNSQGAVVKSSSLNFGSTRFEAQASYFLPTAQVLSNSLSTGIYTLTLEANPSHAVTEAYWFNNTYTATFAVGDAYVSGDVDNDQDVSSVDSTLILRRSAGFSVDLDERAAVRGDVNSDGNMDIIDSTYIQRHLADMNVPFSIDGVALYS